MRSKIVVITSHYLCKPTQQALERLQLDCDTLVTPYDNFDQISQVYDRYADEADGFLVSGHGAVAAIWMQEHETIKPIISFQLDSAALYKSLLELFLNNRQQDARRVVLDFMVPLQGGCSVEDFLHRSEIDSLTPNTVTRVREMGTDSSSGVEQYILSTILEMWERKALDMVICQYSSLIPQLEEHGIPYIYPFLSDSHLKDLVHEVLTKVALEKMRSNLPALIWVSPRSAQDCGDENRAAARRWITQFFKDHLAECIVQENSGYLSMLTSVQTVRYFTRNSTVCTLSKYLAEKLDFEVAVGYGIGGTVLQAMNNAQAAARESMFAGSSFIKDENGDLIGPLGADHNMVVGSNTTQDIAAIAKQSNLSTMTIQKMMTNVRMSGTNLITTQELARRFGVTVRNANRILSNLEKGGFARVVYSQASNSKGRPVKVYELDLGCATSAG